jgi:hypothetical protein
MCREQRKTPYGILKEVLCQAIETHEARRRRVRKRKSRRQRKK